MTRRTALAVVRECFRSRGLDPSLAFAPNTRMHNVSVAKGAACMILRDHGAGWTEIGEWLGVSHSTAMRCRDSYAAELWGRDE